MKRFALLGLVLLAGCGGSGETTARTDDELVADQSIAADVNRALSHVEGVDRLKIQIEVVRGIVSLSGPVSDEAAAKAACAAARKVNGVKGMRDLLERQDHKKD